MSIRIFVGLLFCFYCYTNLVSAVTPEFVNNGMLQPLPIPPLLDEKKVNLGQRLFFDSVLSGNGSQSCASCHKLARGGDDHQQFSRNSLNELRQVNTPTVFNVIHNFKFSIAGNVDSLKTFYSVNLFSRKVMNNSWANLLDNLRANSTYTKLFAEIYSDQISQENVLDVLLEFQASLTTPDSRFDQYLRGDSDAISPYEKKGYRLFREYGCIACHQGKNIGGNLYQKLGLLEDYLPDKNRPLDSVDYGRFNKTGQARDRYVFRVPSLRNVATTAPYLHDGSVNTLDETIRIMGRYQLGRDIIEDDRKAIEAFLRTLTGTYKGKLLEQ